jgi:hypothetical protein
MQLPNILKLYLRARPGRPGLRSIALVAALLRRRHAAAAEKPSGARPQRSLGLGPRSHER